MMNKRRVLTVSFLSLTAFGLLSLLTIFFAGSEEQDEEIGLDTVEVMIDQIKPGTYTIVKWNSYPVAIYRMNKDTIATLISLNDQVFGDPVVEATAPQFYVYKAVSTHLGCRLKHSGDGWHDPCHRGIWDYSGRLFKGITLPYGTKLDNLYPVGYQIIDNKIIRLD